MKKIFLFFFLCIITLYSYSQTGHIEFKNVPVDGKLPEFVKKWRKPGLNWSV